MCLMLQSVALAICRSWLRLVGQADKQCCVCDVVMLMQCCIYR